MDGISNPGLKMAAIKVIMRRAQYIPDVFRGDNDVTHLVTTAAPHVLGSGLGESKIPHHTPQPNTVTDIMR
jgi:hypothetical protein